MRRLWARFAYHEADLSLPEAENRQAVLFNWLLGASALLAVIWMAVWTALGLWTLMAASCAVSVLYVGLLALLNRNSVSRRALVWVHTLSLNGLTWIVADTLGPDSGTFYWVAIVSLVPILLNRKENRVDAVLQASLCLGLTVFTYLKPHVLFDPPQLSQETFSFIELGVLLTSIGVITLIFNIDRQAHSWMDGQVEKARQEQQRQAQLLSQMELDYEVTNRNLSALLNGSKALLLLIDKEGVIVAFNPIFQQYAREIDGNEVKIGDRLFDFSSKFDIGEMQALVERALAGELIQIIKSATDQAGKPVTLEIHVEAVNDIRGQAWGAIITTSDLSEHELDRQKLQRSEANLQALLDSAPDSICSVDLDYRLLTVNEAFNRYLAEIGFSKLEVGDRIIDHFPEAIAKFWTERYQRVFRGESFIETRSSEWNGKEFHREVQMNPIVSPSGEITGAVVQIRGINERKRMERQLIEAKEQAEAGSKAKSRFLAHISHELRNPAHAVLGLTALLAQQSSVIDRESILDLLSRSARRLSDSLENLLDYNLLESGQLLLHEVDFDLEQLLNDSAVLYVFAASQKGLSFETNIPALRRRWLHGDRVRLQRILDTLLDNAVKFTNAGTIRLSVEQSPWTEGGTMTRFTIEDSGEGMTQEIIHQIYEPFMQADSSTKKRVQGLGLGLPIVHQLINLLGGNIEVSSAHGTGTTICVSLPFKPATREEDPPLSVMLPEHAGTARPLRVLLAEDDEANARYVEALLRGLGWEVRWVLNGKQALRQLDRETFDALILDGAMPVMDGIECTEHIRQRQQESPEYPRIPIVVVTGYARGVERDRFLKLKVNAFLTKPVQAHDLIASILKVTSEPAVI